MILLVHLLLGALIGQKIFQPFLAIFLALLSHYIVDAIPHAEYSIENIKNRNWKRAFPDILKVFIDFITGIILIVLFSNNNLIIYVCAFIAILPDGLSVLNLFLKNIFINKHSQLHQGKLHFLKHKKISTFWRLFSQIFIAVLSIYLLISR